MTTIGHGHRGAGILSVSRYATTEDDLGTVLTVLKPILATPQLTLTAEQQLVRVLLAGRVAARRYRAGERHEQLEVAILDGAAAREQLIIANMRLVIHLAFKQRGRGMPVLDLIQEGAIGLSRAIDKYTPTHQTKVATYATWWIRQAMTRAIENGGRTVRLPLHIASQYHTLCRAKRTLSQCLGREPANHELAEHLGWSLDRVVTLLRDTQPIRSLDAPYHTETTDIVGCFGDTLESPDAPIDQELEQAEYQAALTNALHTCLDERERRVMVLRYGLAETTPQTLAGVGQILGLTRERVRQIQRHAEQKLLIALSEPSDDGEHQKCLQGY